jgi:hypothetical protein
MKDRPNGFEKNAGAYNFGKAAMILSKRMLVFF